MSANAPQASASASPVIKIKADLQQIELLKPKSGDLCPSVGQTALFVGASTCCSHVAVQANSLLHLLQGGPTRVCILLQQQSGIVLQHCASFL